MNKLLLTSVFAGGLVAAAVGAGPAMAQSAKYTAAIDNVSLAPVTITTCSTPDNWSTVLNTTIKTANKSDLQVIGSSQIGLFTQTQVKSKGGTTDTSSAETKVKVRVLVDGNPAPVCGGPNCPGGVAYPSSVVFDARKQTLSANLAGLNCTADPVTGVVTCTDPEIIELILDTTSAHSFAFVAPNLASGNHPVALQVAACTATSTTTGTASASVTMGPGTLTVEQVRATNLPDGIVFQ
jgi:hypothetical protein